MKGSGNHFFNKKHSLEVKENLATKARERVLTADHKAKVTAVLRKANFKTPLYDHWLKKYGKDIADEKMAAMKIKKSQNALGENNPMFGKPAPKGSGAGWSGWYNGWFFRSLRELTYVLQIESEGRKWESAESRNYKIEYFDQNGQIRNYFPDFLVDDKFLVEVKPLRLQKTAVNIAKKLAAEKYAVYNQLEYVIIDVIPIKKEILLDLISQNKVVLTDKYKKRLDNE